MKKIVTVEGKKRLPRGFLSVGTNPTQNAIMMYFIYLSYLPSKECWCIKDLNQLALNEVRKYFDVDYGFGTMIMWGILIDCGMSRTSKKRHLAMSKAYNEALGWIGKGYVLTHKKLK